MARQDLTPFQLVLRSLTPSAVSFGTCLLVAVVFTLFHIVLSSVSAGTALPGVLDGQWAVAYTQNVAQPLAEFFGNATLNRLTVACMWGVVGLIVYLGFEYGVHTYHAARDAQKEVVLSASGVYQPRPRQYDYIWSMLWRAGTLVVAVLFIIAIQPLISHALQVAPEVVSSRDFMASGPKVLSALAVWTLVCHNFVVFARLYTMRTRVFGDEKRY